MTDSNGLCSVELMFNESRPDRFKKFMKKDADKLLSLESLLDKVLRAYLRMRLKAERIKKHQKEGT
jgi:hypothetical protein